MSASPATQQHLRILTIELLRAEFAIGQHDPRRPMHRNPLPDPCLLRLGLGCGPPVPRPLRVHGEFGCVPGDIAGAAYGGGSDADDIRRGWLRLILAKVRTV